MDSKRLEEIRELRKLYDGNIPLNPSLSLRTVHRCLTELLTAYDAQSATLAEAKAEIERLKGDWDTQNKAMDYISKDWRRDAALVHEYLQKHGIGLGGENIHKLIVGDAERLRAELERLRAAVTAVLPRLRATRTPGYDKAIDALAALVEQKGGEDGK